MKNLLYVLFMLNISVAYSQTKNVEAIGAIIFNMVAVEYGTFQMGSADGQRDQRPVHNVTLYGFYIMDTEVTQSQWKTIMGNNPSRFKSDDLPVEQVCWDSVQVFISKLNEKSGRTYRLPSEAEWEYAARGGAKSKGYKYAGSNNLVEVAWFIGNSGGTTHKVGTKQPNELGIYDMSGNVDEWCNDIYMPNYYAISPSENPPGAYLGSHRVVRGGHCKMLESYFPSTTWRNAQLQIEGEDVLKSQKIVGFRLVHSR